jgi:hypothetical protein
LLAVAGGFLGFYGTSSGGVVNNGKQRVARFQQKLAKVRDNCDKKNAQSIKYYLFKLRRLNHDPPFKSRPAVFTNPDVTWRVVQNTICLYISSL